MKIDELKGRRFRRNKYGLSLWEDTIKDITVKYELIRPINVKKEIGKVDLYKLIELSRLHGKKHGYKVEVCVIGEKTFSTYNINEIIIF